MLPPDRDWLCQSPDGTIKIGGPFPPAILAGSFNPLHDGHRLLAEIASQKLGVAVAFELSIHNVDKPVLDEGEVRRRLEQFRGFAPIYVTRAPTFEQKAILFPGARFIVGSDTAERIISPRYFQHDPDRRDRSLALIGSLGCRFVVAGRASALRAFVTLEHLEIPSPFQTLFEAIEFRMDISSTELRNQISRDAQST